MEGWLPILLVFVAVAVVAVAIYLLYRRCNPKPGQGKVHGRDFAHGRAVGMARSFARSNHFAFISPAPLRRDDTAAWLDALMVGYFGVLGIITLGYGGEIYGKPEDEKWVQHAEDGSRVTFPNPISEASAAVRVVRDALFAARQKKVPVEIITVFANPRVQLALPRSVQPLRIRDFKKLLKKDKYMDDCGLDIEKVTTVLRAALAEK